MTASHTMNEQIFKNFKTTKTKTIKKFSSSKYSFHIHISVQDFRVPSTLSTHTHTHNSRYPERIFTYITFQPHKEKYKKTPPDMMVSAMLLACFQMGTTCFLGGVKVIFIPILIEYWMKDSLVRLTKHDKKHE